MCVHSRHLSSEVLYVYVLRCALSSTSPNSSHSYRESVHIVSFTKWILSFNLFASSASVHSLTFISTTSQQWFDHYILKQERKFISRYSPYFSFSTHKSTWLLVLIIIKYKKSSPVVVFGWRTFHRDNRLPQVIIWCVFQSFLISESQRLGLLREKYSHDRNPDSRKKLSLFWEVYAVCEIWKYSVVLSAQCISRRIKERAVFILHNITINKCSIYSISKYKKCVEIVIAQIILWEAGMHGEVFFSNSWTICTALLHLSVRLIITGVIIWHIAVQSTLLNFNEIWQFAHENCYHVIWYCTAK